MKPNLLQITVYPFSHLFEKSSSYVHVYVYVHAHVYIYVNVNAYDKAVSVVTCY